MIKIPRVLKQGPCKARILWGKLLHFLPQTRGQASPVPKSPSPPPSHVPVHCAPRSQPVPPKNSAGGHSSNSKKKKVNRTISSTSKCHALLNSLPSHICLFQSSHSSGLHSSHPISACAHSSLRHPYISFRGTPLVSSKGNNHQATT